MIFSKNSVHKIILGYEELQWIDDHPEQDILKKFTISAGINGCVLFTSNEKDYDDLVRIYFESAPKDDE